VTARTRSLAGLLVAAWVVLAGVAVAHAAPVPDGAGQAGASRGPSVVVEHSQLAPGDRVGLTITGFRARVVTISVCGNAAQRGAADCDMVGSKGLRLDAGSPTVSQMRISAPPVPCPCVVRASSPSNDEVAVTPINLAGQEIAPVVGAANADAPLVALSISARPASDGGFGWVRANLGGSVTYEVTVTVTNLTTQPLHQVALAGSVGRGAADRIATLVLVDPAEIGPGQRWQQVVSAVVPAPSFARLEWNVAASHAGPTVAAASVTRHPPLLLLAASAALVLDLALLAIRQRMRRRARQELAVGDQMAPSSA
jgi:hypothetical protein